MLLPNGEYMKNCLAVVCFCLLVPGISWSAELVNPGSGMYPDLLGDESGSSFYDPDLLEDATYIQEPDELLNDPIFEDDFSFRTPVFVVKDPLESMNRVFFEFNDRLYFWVLKPVSKGYAAILPVDIRQCLGNFFTNLAAPIRLVNNLLQGEVEDAGIVLVRFLVNSTAGVLGLGDPAYRDFELEPREADFGQTLGKWGVNAGIYLCLPGLGPSTLRDTVGFAGDVYLHPYPYISQDWVKDIVYIGTDRVNTISLSPSVYDELKRVSLDPYVASRQAYYEYRQSVIAKQ
ncbi:MAG: VacJ family lipoprotein [Desulfocapsaceae bacterium]|jgi:phospholipid-binding lipoprotein MlaA|nr:VacJ family lipoprotein [Desulfocapsaceae bacterium]